VTGPRSHLSLSILQQRIGYSFQNTDLLRQALTHRSAAKSNNERLEFIGDSVVNHVVAVALFNQFPDASEGELSRRRTQYVRGSFLAQIAASWSLGEHLILGAGERKSGGRQRESILGDTVEAIAGAILIDSDLLTARDVVLAWFEKPLEAAPAETDRDPKTRLQEWLQGRGLPLPVYTLRGTEGPDHDQHFLVECDIQPVDAPFIGEGKSRREAEQAAAGAALENVLDG